MTSIRVERDADARVVVLTIDRPEARNACTLAMWAALADALDSAAGDDDVSVVVVTGAGGAFCAGADVKELQGGPPSAPEHSFQRFVEALDAFPKPLVAAVDGVAVGGGFTMLCYFDIVLASPRARFRAPFVAMGLTAEAGSSQLLVQRIGWQRAAELFFTGAWLECDEAVRAGIVRHVVVGESLDAGALELARSIGAMPFRALVETKRLMVAAGRDVAAARAHESAVFASLLATVRARGGEASV